MAAFDEVDLELIGALMDGRLTGAERERAIKLLGESEAAFEVYTDALRVRADLEEVGDNTVVPIDRRRSRKTFAWPAIGSVAAAAVLAIAVLPSVRARNGRSELDRSASQITMALASDPALSRNLAGDWDQRDWIVYRGGGATSVDTTSAFRLGVRATDLNLALATHDRERAQRILGEVLELLQSVKLAESVRAEYGDVRARLSSGQAAEQVLSTATRAEEDLEELLGSRWFGFGKWFAAGEVAAHARSASFFDAPNTGRFLGWTIERGRLAPSDVELLRQVAVLAGQGVNGEEFNTIRQNFAELIRRHGD